MNPKTVKISIRAKMVKPAERNKKSFFSDGASENKTDTSQETRNKMRILKKLLVSAAVPQRDCGPTSENKEDKNQNKSAAALNKKILCETTVTLARKIACIK